MLKDEQLKDTTLDDDASIYKPREEKSEKQKLKDMTGKEKLEYFKNYYLGKTVIVLLALAFTGYLIYSIVGPKANTVLYGAIINYAISEETATSLQDEMADYLGLDTTKENVIIDSTYYFGTGDEVSQYTISSKEKLLILVQATELDFIIAPESMMEFYASGGYFAKITDVLPTDLCNKLKDSMYTATTKEDNVTSSYGIYLDNSNLYDQGTSFTDRPVLGIVINSSNKDNAVEFIRYIFDLK